VCVSHEGGDIIKAVAVEIAYGTNLFPNADRVAPYLAGAEAVAAVRERDQRVSSPGFGFGIPHESDDIVGAISIEITNSANLLNRHIDCHAISSPTRNRPVPERPALPTPLQTPAG
jgi:hypothetical protein